MASELTSEDWAQIRHDYEHTDRPVHEICAERGISTGTLRDRVRRWGWTPRRPPIPLDGPPPLPAPRIGQDASASLHRAMVEDEAGAAMHATSLSDESEPPDIDPEAIGERLQAAVSRVIPAIEQAVARLAAAPAHPRQMEQAARAVAALTRTLRELNALLSRYPAPEPDQEEQLQEFRAELARKIDGIIARRKPAEREQAAGEKAGTTEGADGVEPERFGARDAHIVPRLSVRQL